jgi:hypothetical protein
MIVDSQSVLFVLNYIEISLISKPSLLMDKWQGQGMVIDERTLLRAQ